MHKPPRGVSGYSTDCAKRKGNLLMVTTAPYSLFPIDGNGNPPTDEEIGKEIETIITLYDRGFISKKAVVETMASFARCAMLYGYANGIKDHHS